MYEHVVEVQTRMQLVGAAGPTKNSWSWVRQQAKAGSLVLQSLTLTLQDQVQQGLWLFLLAAPTLQQQHRDYYSCSHSGEVNYDSQAAFHQQTANPRASHSGVTTNDELKLNIILFIGFMAAAGDSYLAPGSRGSDPGGQSRAEALTSRPEGAAFRTRTWHRSHKTSKGSEGPEG